MREKEKKKLNLRHERILIVEDSQGIQKVLHGLLKRVGATEIKMASDGEVALTIIKSWLPTIILSDWEMAPMGGKKFIQSLRNLPGKASRAPVIVITAHSENKAISEIVAAGANQIQVKPVVPDQLFNRLAWVIENRHKGLPELKSKMAPQKPKAAMPPKTQPKRAPAAQPEIIEETEDAWLI
jgi:CheY-like chemotaxis protein